MAKTTTKKKQTRRAKAAPAKQGCVQAEGRRDRPQEEVVIPALKESKVTFSIVGTSPLLSNRRNHPAVVKALDGTAKIKEKVSPPDQYERSMWRTADGYGYPTLNLGAALIDGFRHVSGVTMAGIRGTIIIESDALCDDGTPLVLIRTEGDPENNGRIVGGGKKSKVGAVLKHTAMFRQWKMVLTCVFDPTLVSQEQVLLAWQFVGKYVGLGSWRPDCGGVFGRFMIT